MQAPRLGALVVVVAAGRVRRAGNPAHGGTAFHARTARSNGMKDERYSDAAPCPAVMRLARRVCVDARVPYTAKWRFGNHRSVGVFGVRRPNLRSVERCDETNRGFLSSITNVLETLCLNGRSGSAGVTSVSLVHFDRRISAIIASIDWSSFDPLVWHHRSAGSGYRSSLEYMPA